MGQLMTGGMDVIDYIAVEFNHSFDADILEGSHVKLSASSRNSMTIPIAGVVHLTAFESSGLSLKRPSLRG